MRLPTREEHRRAVTRMWCVCIAVSVLIFFGAGGTIMFFLVWSGHDMVVVDTISSKIWHVVIISYAIAFFVPAFITSLKTIGLGVEMSRESLEIGRKTAVNIDSLKGKLEKVADDLQETVSSFRDIVNQVKEKELGKEIDRIFQDGSLREAIDAIKQVPAKIDELIQKAGKKGVEDTIDNL